MQVPHYLQVDRHTCSSRCDTPRTGLAEVNIRNLPDIPHSYGQQDRKQQQGVQAPTKASMGHRLCNAGHMECTWCWPVQAVCMATSRNHAPLKGNLAERKVLRCCSLAVQARSWPADLRLREELQVPGTSTCTLVKRHTEHLTCAPRRWALLACDAALRSAVFQSYTEQSMLSDTLLRCMV